MILYEVKRVVNFLKEEPENPYSGLYARKVKNYVKRLGKYNEYISKDELYTIVGVEGGRFITANVIGTMDSASAQELAKAFKK